MIELVMHTKKNDMVFHTEKTRMMILVVEIDVVGMIANVVDKVTCSFDDWQLKQVDLKCIHALNKLHLHDIRVVPNRHEVDQHNLVYFFGLVTPFSLTVSQRSGPFSKDLRIIHPCCLFNIYSSILLFHESYISFSNIGKRLSAPDRIALSARLVILKCSSPAIETITGSSNFNSTKKSFNPNSQAGSDPSKTLESRPPHNQEFMEEDQAGKDPGVSRVALAGTNSKPTHEEFMANVYLDVHGSLKLPVDEHVIIEEPLSSFGTLLSMKNLDDAYTFRDHNNNAYNNSPSTSTSSTTTKSWVFTLELWDLPHKIDQTINTVVKEANHIALQAPLRDHFRELPKADIKEILHQRMFESGSYKSLLEHVALYEAPKESMEWDNMDEFLTKKDKSRKRRRDDQDPLPYPSDLDPNKVNVSDSKDTDTAHLSKLKTRPDWMKPIPKEDMLATPEPD
nr:hypothetical protein [Tanacetum cinerariifolium]